jgi:hypothetical protein
LISTVQQFRYNIEKYIFRNHFPYQQFQLAGAGMNLDILPSGESSESSIFSDFLWFAAPKSKVRCNLCNPFSNGLPLTSLSF